MKRTQLPLIIALIFSMGANLPGPCQAAAFPTKLLRSSENYAVIPILDPYIFFKSVSHADLDAMFETGDLVAQKKYAKRDIRPPREIRVYRCMRFGQRRFLRLALENGKVVDVFNYESRNSPLSLLNDPGLQTHTFIYSSKNTLEFVRSNPFNPRD
jgi:hypothetical protein